MRTIPLPLWDQTSSLLAGRLSAEAHRRWIAPLSPLDLSGDMLTLGVANDFFQSWLQDNYLPLIEASLSETAGRIIRVKFTTSTHPIASDAVPAPAESPFPFVKERRPIETDLNPAYVFDSFIVGQNNLFAHAAALGVAQSPGVAHNPLFLYGNTGLGKTHLMQAIGNMLRSRRARVVYVTAEEFTNEFIDMIRTRNFARFRKKFRAADALLIDDVHFLIGKEQTQEEFFHTFNQLHNFRKQIVLSCDRPATEIKGLEERLVSRFEWGQVTELLPPDFETRVAILRKKVEIQRLAVSEEIISFIAKNIRANVRRLESALIRVASFGSLAQRSPTITDAENLLRDVLLEEGRQAVTIPIIQKRVVAHFDILPSDMTSKRRPREIAFARQVAMYLSRRLTTASLTEIGEAFGGRDHGTVLHACRLVQQRASKESGLRQTLALLSKQLGQ